MTGEGDLTGVEGGATLHAGTDVRSGGVNQGHGLALHVRTHQGTLGVVVLQERNQGCGDGDHLARGHVHVVDHLDGHVCRSTEGAVEVAGTGDDGMGTHHVAIGIGRHELVRIGIERRVSRGDDVILFLVSGHPVDLIRRDAVLDAAIRSLDEAVLVHTGVQREGADQADVGAFGRLDGAHAGVVRVMDVADRGRDVRTAAGAGLVTGKATGTQRGQTALVRKAGQRVGLVHELGELRGAEELLDGSHDRTDVDQALRRDLIDVLRAHALAHDALHTAHTDTELVGNELAHGADAAVAEVVDIVRLEARDSGSELEEIAQRGNDILIGKHGDVLGGIETELLVDLVATNASQVVALRVEQQALEQAAGSVDGRRLARTQATIDLDEGVLARQSGIALDGALHDVGVTEHLDDLIVGRSDAESTQEHGRRLLALAVDGDHELIALIDLELEPRATRRDDLRLINLLAAIHLRAVVNARGTDQLRDDDALGTVDDKGALIGHHGEIAHEDQLLLDLTGLLIGQANIGQQRSLIGHILLAALINRVSGVAELVITKGDLQHMVLALDRTGLLESLAKSIGHEALKALLLNGDEIRQLHHLGDLSEVDARALCCRYRQGGFCITHQAFPPSWENAV